MYFHEKTKKQIKIDETSDKSEQLGSCDDFRYHQREKYTTLIAIRDQSIFMGIRDLEFEFSFVKITAAPVLSQSAKTLKVLQDVASNARLIHAEGQNASIDDKISQVLNF